jgi:phosphohistidine phosphatase SixA
VEGQSDLERKLSETGVQQASARGNDISKRGIWDFELVVTSTAGRTLDTARQMADLQAAEVVQLEALYPQGEDLDKAFKKLGYKSYGEYIADTDGRCVEGIGKNMATALKDTLQRHPRAKKVLVIGHAVVLTSLVCDMGSRIPIGTLHEMEDYALQECEGYVLYLNEEDVVYAAELIRG